MRTDLTDVTDLADLVAAALRDTDGVVDLHPNPRAVLRGLVRRVVSGERVDVDVQLFGDRAVVNADIVIAPGQPAIEAISAAQRNAAAALATHVAELEVDICLTAQAERAG